jgi:peptide/nickel transport system substrate-binding protein
MHSDVKILDPIWTTAYIQRNHGYMVWDTLSRWTRSSRSSRRWSTSTKRRPTKLTWTFTLRDGLEWSDGKPVTSKTASPRSSAGRRRDSMGQKMMGSVESLEVVDPKTFR